VNAERGQCRDTKTASKEMDIFLLLAKVTPVGKKKNSTKRGRERYSQDSAETLVFVGICFGVGR